MSKNSKSYKKKNSKNKNSRNVNKTTNSNSNNDKNIINNPKNVIDSDELKNNSIKNNTNSEKNTSKITKYNKNSKNNKSTSTVSENKSKIVEAFKSLSNEITSKTNKITNIKNRMLSNPIISFLYDFRYLLYSAFIVYIVTKISPIDTNMSQKEYMFTLAGNLFLFYLIGSFLLLFKRGNILFALYSISWIVLSTVNYFLIEFRATGITKYDLLCIKEGISISQEFFIPEDYKLIFNVCIISLVLLAFSIIRCKKFRKIKSINYCLLIPISIFMINTSNVFGVSNESTTYISHKNGFVKYFTESVFSKDMVEPENYSKENILAIKNVISNDSKEVLNNDETDLSDNKNLNSESSEELNTKETTVNNPNIIAVQLETFFDPKDVLDLTISENPIPFFDSLKENYSSGYVTVPTIGGGTAMSEYEFLTSMSLDSFPRGALPHNMFLKKKSMVSIPSLMKDSGYSTHLLHNYLGDYYNRDLVYEHLGFDTFTSKEYMPNVSYSPEDKYSGDVSLSKDETLMNEVFKLISSDNINDNDIKKECKSDSNFIFAITSQLHAPYDNKHESHNNEIKVESPFSQELNQEFQEYINRLSAIDSIMEDFIFSWQEDLVLIFD